MLKGSELHFYDGGNCNKSERLDCPVLVVGSSQSFSYCKLPTANCLLRTKALHRVHQCCFYRLEANGNERDQYRREACRNENPPM
jgi:hypothetical protein